MEKHFLITISNDAGPPSGVDFICSFFKKISEHQVTLLHICRLDQDNLGNALTEMWMAPEESTQGQVAKGAQKAIRKASTLLSNSKMSIDQMITKTVPERYGKVKDILAEGENGLYDAIILGKRASYALQWMIERPADEIAQAMIKDRTLLSPLWICPEPELNRKNVLLCVDGSENSCRVVDHVGYILSLQDQHTITLFHVNRGTGPAPEEIFDRAEAILHEHKITNDRIRRETSWGMSVASTILSKVEAENYAAAAVGLHGLQQTLLKEYRLEGGTTAKLIQKIEKASLWCCP